MPRTLDFPLRISVDELAYLLSTLHATHIPGLKIPNLLPKNKETKYQQFQRGYETLLQKGWLQEVALEGRTRLDLHSNLMEYMAALADPEAALTANIQERSLVVSTGLLIYFSNNKTLEVTPLEDGILVRPLDSMAVAWQSLSDWLRIPEHRGKFSEVILPKQAAHSLAAGNLEAQRQEMQPTLSALIETRRHLAVSAQLMVMKIRDATVVKALVWGVLVGGKQKQLAWLFEEMETGIRYVSCDQLCFHKLLQTSIIQFITSTPISTPNNPPGFPFTTSS